MILVKPSFEIMHITERPLHHIEAAGRTCYKSEDKITITSAGNFVEMLLKRGHESVLEHASASVRIICDRGVSHEIVRHRLASYSQESTRYCDYAGGQVTFVIPPWVDAEPGLYYGSPLARGEGIRPDEWLHAMRDAEESYRALRRTGWKPEQARAVLPNSLKTEIVMTANFREWRHFFNLRDAPAAHPQMREIAAPLHQEFRSLVPIIFD